MNTKSKTFEVPPATDLNQISSDAPIFVSEDLEGHQVLTLAKFKGIHHIVQKPNLEFEKELELAHKMEQDPASFAASPLATIFGQNENELPADENFRPKNFTVTDIRDKNIILRTLEKHCEFLKVKSTLMDDLRLAADELITNAIYNAPFVDGDKVLTGPSRKHQDVNIDPQKQPSFFWQADEQRIVIGCKDHYGNLRISHMLNRICLCYQDGPSQHVNYGAGGAGIGAFLVFRSCASFYVAVQRGVYTVVCCSFPYRMSGNKREALPKNIHWFEHET